VAEPENEVWNGSSIKKFSVIGRPAQLKMTIRRILTGLPAPVIRTFEAGCPERDMLDERISEHCVLGLTQPN
jgi:hypothetical protein